VQYLLIAKESTVVNTQCFVDIKKFITLCLLVAVVTNNHETYRGD